MQPYTLFSMNGTSSLERIKRNRIFSRKPIIQAIHQKEVLNFFFFQTGIGWRKIKNVECPLEYTLDIGHPIAVTYLVFPWFLYSCFMLERRVDCSGRYGVIACFPSLTHQLCCGASFIFKQRSFRFGTRPNCQTELIIITPTISTKIDIAITMGTFQPHIQSQPRIYLQQYHRHLPSHKSEWWPRKSI